MGSFSLRPLLPASKIRITSIHQHGDNLYAGSITGAVQVYKISGDEDGKQTIKLLKTHNLSKRQIDQLAVLPISNQLAVLSDSIVTLYNLGDLATSKGKVLNQARNAHTLAISTFNPSLSKGKKPASSGSGDDAALGELLVVGCRKKVVVYGGLGNGMKDVWEIALPHSPRKIVIPTSARAALPESIHLLYSTQSSVILHLNPTSKPNLSISELPITPPPAAMTNAAAFGSSSATAGGTENTSALSGLGAGALSGLGGYVGLGGKTPIPVGASTVAGEVLLGKDDLGVFYSSEGNYTRPSSLQWSTPPDALVYSNPYIYSALTIPSSSSGVPPSASIQIHLAPTLLIRNTLHLPAPATGSLSISSFCQATVAGATPAEMMQASTKLYCVSTPTDKALLQSEGSTIWAIEANHIGEQVDVLVKEGRVGDAIGLVESVGENGLSPTRRISHLKTLQAVTQFAKGQYQSAMDTFLINNINPALVISLYPAETISGRSHVPRDKWMESFGAVPGARLEPASEEAPDAPAKSLLKTMAHLGGLKKKSSNESIRPGSPATKEDGGSAEDEKAAPPITGNETPRAALEALMYFLSDRRQKLTGAISALPVTSPLPAESSLPPLSSLPADELHSLPNVPFSELSPEQLLRVAQVIYTALLKVYLVARPVLVGSLCRIENWCDVEEVEELLKAQKKFSDLIDLYQGKKMHAKALNMLHDLAKDEEDKLDRYPPTIRYLQKLGPGELPLILESSKWIFAEDPSTGLQIFTADEPEVEALPRTEVAGFLEKEDQGACIGYLRHILELGEQGSDLHDKLAELYLNRSQTGKDAAIQEAAYSALLSFLNESTHYRPYRLMNRLKGDDCPEARAILLGRMGKHEDALRIYIYRLQDHQAAENHCSKVYQATPDPQGIFLLLLRLYLQPIPPDPVHLTPALELIARQGPRLDASGVLDLLPPLVTMEDVKDFFIKTLRNDHAKSNDWKIIRNVAGARKEEVDRVLMGLQVQRVRISDQRICPQCQKRLGQSAIAVHAPRGEVTHLHCKDLFSAKLNKSRG